MTTTAKTTLQDKKLSDVTRVYSGRIGCACGCRGNYRRASWNNDPLDADDMINDVQVRKIFLILKEAPAEMVLVDENLEWASIEYPNENRVYTAYFK